MSKQQSIRDEDPVAEASSEEAVSLHQSRKGFRYLKHYGPKEFWIRLHERFEPEEVPYDPMVSGLCSG